MFDLINEIITFGPKMAHDDTIDALAYACKFSHPPQGMSKENGNWHKYKPSARNWVVA